jgi:uncharacterized membrane protein YcaP (DUF421 family)
MLDNLSSWLEFVFGGDMPAKPLLLAQVAARAAVVYIVGLLLVRIGKSRLLSRATALDVILLVVVGSLLSRGINGSASLSGTITACAVLVALHSLITSVTSPSTAASRQCESTCQCPKACPSRPESTESR